MDWTAVLQQATAAAESVFNQNWNAVATSAAHSISMLTQTAQYIAEHPGIPAPQRQLLINNQKLAMQNSLLGYEDVGILLAEEAVAAAWSVVSKALQTAVGAAIP